MGNFSRYLGVCSAADREAINARLEVARHPVHGYTYGPNNMRIRCSATGQEPATHYACGFAADGSMLAQIDGLKALYQSIAIYADWVEAERNGIKAIPQVLS